MLVPATHQAALLLLLLALVCLGSWANTLKLGGSRWRWELFYFDFAAGAFLLSLLAALTLGTLGSELSFNDRIAVAGLRSQVFAIGAGMIFNLGNMLLVATVSLIGMAAGFPLVLGLALMVSAAAGGVQGVNPLFLAGGVVLVLAAVALAGAAARRRIPARTSGNKQAVKAAGGRSAKALATGIIGGFLIGISAPLAESGLWGDLGLGAYAGGLMFAIGLLISAFVLNLFFMGIGIEGGRITFGDYFKGSVRQHSFGVAGGMLWALGTLAALLAQSVPTAEQPGAGTLMWLTQGSVLLAVAWGLLAWKEFGNAPARARTLILASATFFAAGLACLALRFRP